MKFIVIYHNAEYIHYICFRKHLTIRIGNEMKVNFILLLKHSSDRRRLHYALRECVSKSISCQSFNAECEFVAYFFFLSSHFPCDFVQQRFYVSLQLQLITHSIVLRSIAVVSQCMELYNNLLHPSNAFFPKSSFWHWHCVCTRVSFDSKSS